MDYPYIGQSFTAPNATPPDPTVEPVEITAGDSVIFTRSLSDYKASDGWRLVYAGRSSVGKIDFASTASNDDHAVSILPTSTDDWIAGIYKMQGYAVNTDGRRQTIYTGELKVNVNYSAITTAVETRTTNQIILDNIRAVMVGKAGTDVLSSSIEGVSLGHADWDQLIRLESTFAIRVASEQRALDVKAGKGGGRSIRFRFTR